MVLVNCQSGAKQSAHIRCEQLAFSNSNHPTASHSSVDGAVSSWPRDCREVLQSGDRFAAIIKTTITTATDAPTLTPTTTATAAIHFLRLFLLDLAVVTGRSDHHCRHAHLRCCETVTNCFELMQLAYSPLRAMKIH